MITTIYITNLPILSGLVDYSPLNDVGVESCPTNMGFFMVVFYEKTENHTSLFVYYFGDSTNY